MLGWTALVFVLGAFSFLKKGKALYAQMITLGIGCAMLGRLYNVAAIFADLHTRTEFNVGLLGMVGCFLFFFTANFGHIDSLTDDRSEQYAKYRRIAWLAPAVNFALYLPVLFSDTNIETKIVCFVVTYFAMQTSYYHLKHLIIPDVLYGVAKCIRSYNLLALLYTFSCVFEFTAYVWRWELPLHFAYLLNMICVAGIVPALRKGVRAWTI